MTSENNSEAVEFKPIFALDKLDPKLGDRQLYPQNHESFHKYERVDLSKYKPQKVT
jgi:hypothetical protein